MSGISSGIGLISGIDTATLIDQLMSIERAPIENLQQRVTRIDVQRAAFLNLSARLLSVQNAVSGFAKPSFFKRFSAASSNEKVLTATAGSGAVPGAIAFKVRSLVSSHAVISRGFADSNATTVGSGALTVEVGHGKVNRSTELAALKGGAGVGRGVIAITDRAGVTADIDLTTAITVQDVLDAINTAPGLQVRAYVTGIDANGASGDRIVIEDVSGGAGTLRIVDKLAGTTAADLGIAGIAAAGRIDGSDLVVLSRSTPLSFLNDGNGIDRSATGTDLTFTTGSGSFDVSLANGLVGKENTDLRVLNGGNGVRLGVIRITDRSGAFADIDLAGAATPRDILDGINASSVSVNATIFGIGDASHFLISDETGTTGDDAPPLKIEDVSGFTAADLGIDGEFVSGSVTGKNVYRISTLGDVLNLINFANGNNGQVQADISADGNGLTLTALVPGSSVTVTAGTGGSTAATDLGLLNAVFDDTTPFVAPEIMAGLNTVLLKSLNGGAGVGAGPITLTDRAGATTTIDLAAAQTLADVIDLINADGATGFLAAVNTAGNGMALIDQSGGAGPLSVVDAGGTLAADLGVDVPVNPPTPFAGNVINGGNAQLQYITRQTQLATLNNGRGVRAGQLQITDSTGAAFAVTVGANIKTVGEVIDRINAATPDTIVARVNDTGDGILVTDTSAGPDPLKIEELQGGALAADLRLLGTSDPGQNQIDGSYEIRIDIDSDDTLSAIAQKINGAGGGFAASILNHGGSINPFSLSISSTVSGRAGELTLDAIGIDLGFTTLTRPRDAVITIGDDAAGTPLLVTGSSNTLDDVLEDVSLNLLSTSDESVTVSIAQDVDGIVEAIGTFVTAFNDVIDTIDESTSFNPDTLERGVLLGDATVSTVRSRLTSIVLRKFEGVPDSVSRLFAIGLRLGSGNRLEFDEQKFREVYENSPQLVEELFTAEETGVGAVLTGVLEDMTREFDGLIDRKNELLADQQELLNDRIASLEVLLDAKRARLEAQFVGLESALAALQSQQNSLNFLSQLI